MKNSFEGKTDIKLISQLIRNLSSSSVSTTIASGRKCGLWGQGDMDLFKPCLSYLTLLGKLINFFEPQFIKNIEITMLILQSNLKN